MPSQFGTTGYTLTETYSSLRGGISQTTVSGADRYSLLEAWQDTSASGVSGGDGIGMAEHQPYGVPVVTVSWWNAPLAADKGNPWGNGGDALKDTDYSGEGGDFGPPRSLTDKLLDPIQEVPDQRGFWEKASEWLPGVSTVRDLGLRLVRWEPTWAAGRPSSRLTRSCNACTKTAACNRSWPT